MSKFDCENRTDSCDNATICPCMNYIDKERRSYSELLISKKLHTFTDEQLDEHDKQIREDAIEEYTDWLFNEGYIGLHWNNPTNAIQNLLNKYKEQMRKGAEE